MRRGRLPPRVDLQRQQEKDVDELESVQRQEHVQRLADATQRHCDERERKGPDPCYDPPRVQPRVLLLLRQEDKRRRRSKQNGELDQENPRPFRCWKVYQEAQCCVILLFKRSCKYQ